MFRTRLQRLALIAIGGVFLTLGASRLADAAGTVDAPAVPTHTVSQAILFDETFSVREGASLAVNLGAEAVVVRAVSGTRARVRVEGTGRDAADEFERRRFTARAENGGLAIRTNPPRRWSLFGGGRRSARFTVTIEVPRRFNASIDVGSGAVSVASLDGEVGVDTGSGAVRLGDVRGDVGVDTGSGAVVVGDVRGDVKIDTGSGAVRVEDVGGSLSVDTGSGGVSAGRVEGPVDISTGSGGASVSVSGRHQVGVNTGSGNATVAVPRASGWNVQLEGGSIAIDDALRFRGERERREARGEIGGGGPDLHVRTGSGRIRIDAR